MPASQHSLKDRLDKSSEITISVTGRKSGKTISNPVWFVLEGNTLYLLPVKGSDTQWYKNVMKNPAMKIAAGGTHEEIKATPVTNAAEVKSVTERFRGKYGPGDVKKYYSKFDVAVTAHGA